MCSTSVYCERDPGGICGQRTITQHSAQSIDKRTGSARSRQRIEPE
jgi:hypothetical protein